MADEEALRELRITNRVYRRWLTTRTGIQWDLSMLKKPQYERLEKLSQATARDSSAIVGLINLLPDEGQRLTLHNLIMGQWIEALLVADRDGIADMLKKEIEREKLPSIEDVRMSPKRYCDVTLRFKDDLCETGWRFTKKAWGELLQPYGHGGLFCIQMSPGIAFAVDAWICDQLHDEQGLNLTFNDRGPEYGAFLGYAVWIDKIRGDYAEYIILDFGLIDYGGVPPQLKPEI